MRHSRKRHWGFGLIEILVTLGVLSVGIVGVTVLHSTVTKQSSENKSRAEALAIAQSRIEDMRNYTGAVNSLSDFNTAFANTTGFGNTATVSGTNASFTRTEQISSTGDMKTVAVRVAWSDAEGESQNVTLNTRLSYIPPRSIGDTALEAATSVVDAPTGRARLGEGELPEDAATTPNGDGTSLYDANFDRMLVSGDQIVLTLAEACQTENANCVDFVRIKGRVWIDQSTQGSLNPGEVYVIASDAAYCARHFTPTGATSATPVTPTTTQTLLTANGNYEWFDYTCYIGGGWHGNIGILLADGLSGADKICVGDPVTTDPWATPVIAARRVYRGMLYKTDASTASGKEEISTSSGPMVRYYSQGIADATVLPVPNSGQKPHDFVIGSFNQNLTDGSNCETQGIMVRADATVSSVSGALFAGIPTDFVCLNDGYLDNHDAAYGSTSTCPYDPSDPPSTSHEISGSIRLDADDTTANDVIASTIAAHTSDGPGNCATSAASPAHDGTYYQFTYTCTVYDWGNGWNGFIEADYDAAEMECTPYQLTRSNVTGDTANVNFTNCTTGSFAVISGTVTSSGSRKLASATMGTAGACTIATNGLSYECISTEYTGPTQTFTITFTPTGGSVCDKTAPHSGTTGVFPYTNQAAGNYTQNLKIVTNLNQC